MPLSTMQTRTPGPLHPPHAQTRLGAVGQRTGSAPGADCPTVLQAIASAAMAGILAGEIFFAGREEDRDLARSGDINQSPPGRSTMSEQNTPDEQATTETETEAH